jgi:NAD(P)-dependent dehydrogenase (short-subunit alcohol dehydrogenase family)
MTSAADPEFPAGAVIVAGGSGGIGAAIVRLLAGRGTDVAFTYHANQAGAEALAAEVQAEGRAAMPARLDLRDAPAVKAFVDGAVARFGRIHSVVYAAGPPIPMRFINELDPETWARVFRADVEGCFNLVWAALPHLKQVGGGSIVAVITAAADRPPPKDILSAAPKAAIQALIRGLAREEGRFGIRANCVGPGWIDAGLGAEILSGLDQKTYIDRFTAQIPLRRVGEADDIAQAVAFLLSDKAKYVTGATLPVAGGLQL